MQAQKSVDEMYKTKIAELDTAADKHKAEKKKLEMALAAEKVLNEEQKTAHSKEIEELRATHAKELEDKDAFIQKQGHALQLWKAHETKHKERLQRKDAPLAQLRLDLGPERAQARLEKQLSEDCSWRKEKTSCATLRGTRNLAGSGPSGRSPCKTQGPWLSGPFIPKWTQHNMTWGRPLPRSRLHLPHRPASARRPFPRFRFWTFRFADSQLVVIWQDSPKHVETRQVRLMSYTPKTLNPKHLFSVSGIDAKAGTQTDYWRSGYRTDLGATSS